MAGWDAKKKKEKENKENEAEKERITWTGWDYSPNNDVSPFFNQLNLFFKLAYVGHKRIPLFCFVLFCTVKRRFRVTLFSNFLRFFNIVHFSFFPDNNWLKSV